MIDQWNRKRERGFTLAELLTVIVIIALLAGMTLAVQRASVQSARRYRTQMTIKKIDTVLSSLYESYQYRKVDLSYYFEPDPRVAFDALNYYGCSLQNSSEITNLHRMMLRTLELRKHLVLEFPTSIEEVFAEYPGELPALNQSYRAVVKDGVTNAELLYLIVMNGDPEARGMFQDSEIAMREGGGNYFVDGWGNPICFLRWAPAFASSSRQPLPNPAYTQPNEGNIAPGEGTVVQAFHRYQQAQMGIIRLSEDQLTALTTLLTDAFRVIFGYGNVSVDEVINNPDTYYQFHRFIERFSDPLDPFGLLDGWFLVPLVVSAGPDEDLGMDPPAEVCLDPFADRFPLGLERDAARDNMTNHSDYNE